MLCEMLPFPDQRAFPAQVWLRKNTDGLFLCKDKNCSLYPCVTHELNGLKKKWKCLATAMSWMGGRSFEYYLEQEWPACLGKTLKACSDHHHHCKTHVLRCSLQICEYLMNLRSYRLKWLLAFVSTISKILTYQTNLILKYVLASPASEHN